MSRGEGYQDFMTAFQGVLVVLRDVFVSSKRIKCIVLEFSQFCLKEKKKERKKEGDSLL